MVMFVSDKAAFAEYPLWPLTTTVRYSFRLGLPVSEMVAGSVTATIIPNAGTVKTKGCSNNCGSTAAAPGTAYTETMDHDDFMAVSTSAGSGQPPPTVISFVVTEGDEMPLG